MSGTQSARLIREKFKDLKKAQVFISDCDTQTVQTPETDRIFYKCYCHNRIFQNFTSLLVHIQNEGHSVMEDLVDFEKVSIKQESLDFEFEQFTVVKDENPPDLDLVKIKQEFELDENGLDTKVESEGIVLVDCTQPNHVDFSFEGIRSTRKRKLPLEEFEKLVRLVKTNS